MEQETQIEKKSDEAVEKIAKDLNINIPKSEVPLLIRIIALLLLAGGISLVSSLFTDIFGTTETFGHNFLRFMTGLAMMSTSYGLIKKKLWALYLYGVFVGISIVFNPTLAVFFSVILTYLIFERRFFEAGMVDAFVKRFIAAIREMSK